MDWTAPCTVPECSDGRIIGVRDGKTYVSQCTCARGRVVYSRNTHEKPGRRNGFPKNGPPPMLSDFDPGWGSSPNGRTFQGAAAKLGKLWLDAWSPGVGALIYGVTGSGKTRLATALANELAMRRNYFSAQMVCVAAHIPSTGFDADKWRSKIRPAARRAHVLIIDNLRADFEPFRVSELADLCEHAVRDRRAVIFTTTLNPSQLVGAGAWGDVCSRIGEIAGKWRFDLGGTDFRQPKPTPDARQRAAGDFD